MFKRIRRKMHWKKVLKKSEPYSYTHSLVILKTSLEDLLDESLEYIFIPEVEKMCFELMETISNLNMMETTEDEDTYNMLKHRVMYMLNNRLENWYI